MTWLHFSNLLVLKIAAKKLKRFLGRCYSFLHPESWTVTILDFSTVSLRHLIARWENDASSEIEHSQHNKQTTGKVRYDISGLCSVVRYFWCNKAARFTNENSMSTPPKANFCDEFHFDGCKIFLGLSNSKILLDIAAKKFRNVLTSSPLWALEKPLKCTQVCSVFSSSRYLHSFRLSPLLRMRQ